MIINLIWRIRVRLQARSVNVVSCKPVLGFLRFKPVLPILNKTLLRLANTTEIECLTYPIANINSKVKIPGTRNNTTDLIERLALASFVIEGESIFAANWQTHAFTGQWIKEVTVSTETFVCALNTLAALLFPFLSTRASLFVSLTAFNPLNRGSITEALARRKVPSVVWRAFL